MDTTAKPKRKKQILIAALVVLLLAVAGVAYLLLGQDTDGSGLELDDNATMGILPGIDIAQRQDELQQLQIGRAHV